MKCCEAVAELVIFLNKNSILCFLFKGSLKKESRIGQNPWINLNSFEFWKQRLNCTDGFFQKIVKFHQILQTKVSVLWWIIKNTTTLWQHDQTQLTFLFWETVIKSNWNSDISSLVNLFVTPDSFLDISSNSFVSDFSFFLLFLNLFFKTAWWISVCFIYLCCFAMWFLHLSV